MVNDFGVGEMLDMQKELQEKYKDKWEPIGPECGKSHLLWMVGEIGEVIDVIKKHGTEEIGTNPEIRSDLIEEMADVLMHYADVMLCFGISPEELRRSFIGKFEKNMNRW